MEAIIEIPKGDDRRRHIKYDKSGFVDLGPIKDIIPANNGVMPIHYGYIPNTLNVGEGDEIDILILSEKSFKAGQEIEVEPIALIKRADGDDKIVAIDDTIKNIKSWEDVSKNEQKLIEDFFSYHHKFNSIENAEVANLYVEEGVRQSNDMIGLKRGTVKLVHYSPKWSSSFEGEAKKLKKIFGRDCIDIQHVGSTAISKILAKPIIDIALIASSLKKANSYIKKMEREGYELKKNDTRKDRLFLTKGPENKRTHYLHIGEIGSGYAEDTILFRDYLLDHKNAAMKYSGLKEKLAKKYQDNREIYTAKKTEFIEEIVEKAKKSLIKYLK